MLRTSGVRRNRFHPVRAERRRSVSDQCDVIPNPSAAASQHRALSQIRRDLGRGEIRTIVSTAMRRSAGSDPILAFVYRHRIVSAADTRFRPSRSHGLQLRLCRPTMGIILFLADVLCYFQTGQ
jgi:hypothetical protein